MGLTTDWQNEVQSKLSDLNITLFNPRRSDWDETWEQDKSDKNFHQQVSWELDHLEAADMILFYFAPQSKAPITLLELGLFAKSGKCIVCCPQEYWRRGNVQITCERYKIPFFDIFDNMLSNIRHRVETAHDDVAG